MEYRLLINILHLTAARFLILSYSTIVLLKVEQRVRSLLRSVGVNDGFKPGKNYQ